MSALLHAVLAIEAALTRGEESAFAGSRTEALYLLREPSGRSRSGAPPMPPNPIASRGNEHGEVNTKEMSRYTAPPGSSDSSASSEDSSKTSPVDQPGVFFDVARFWKGVEATQLQVPSPIPHEGGYQLNSEFNGLGASSSTLSGSRSNNADEGSDVERSYRGLARSSSAVEQEIGEWARRAHLDDIAASDDGSASAYSHASAVDLTAIDEELGLSEEVGSSPVTTSHGTRSAVDEFSPPCAPRLPSLPSFSPPCAPRLPSLSENLACELQQHPPQFSKNLDDMKDLRLDSPPPSCSGFTAVEPLSINDGDVIGSDFVEDGYLDVDEDHLGGEGRHIYGSQGRQCSFAESFARRKGLGLRAARGQNSSRDNSASRQEAGGIASFRGPEGDRIKRSIAMAKRHGATLDSAGLIGRASHALVELLDEKKAAASRLTEGTRAFSTVFTADEKDVFGVVVRGALAVIKQRNADKNANKFKKDVGRFELAKTHGGGQVVLHKAKGSGPATKSKKSAAPEPNLLLTQRVLLGTVTKPKSRSKAAGSRNAPAPSIMLITDGKVTGEVGTQKADPGNALSMTPCGPLAKSSSNEIMFIQLPFASALLSVLAALARLDCELIFKRRKNRSGDLRRNFLSENDAATVHARARQDRSNRHFTFSVVVQGSSPTRITFRRPKFIALRRVDDYVDIVLDSKELITEYCTSMWGQGQTEGR